MKIYLAARYGRKAEISGYAAELQVMGHEVIARWLNSPEPADNDWNTAVWGERAVEDLADISQCNCVISFTEPLGSTFPRGSRHAEFGIGIAGGQRSIVAGHRENVFHCLPFVEFYETWSEARAALR